MKANRFLPYNFLREKSTNVNFPDVDLVQFIQEVIDDGDLDIASAQMVDSVGNGLAITNGEITLGDATLTGNVTFNGAGEWDMSVGYFNLVSADTLDIVATAGDITINASGDNMMINANATMTVTAVTYDLDAVDVEITATNDVTVDVTGVLSIAGLSTYADNAAALAGGLVATNLYRTGTGVLMIVY